MPSVLGRTAAHSGAEKKTELMWMMRVVWVLWVVRVVWVLWVLWLWVLWLPRPAGDSRAPGSIAFTSGGMAQRQRAPPMHAAHAREQGLATPRQGSTRADRRAGGLPVRGRTGRTDRWAPGHWLRNRGALGGGRRYCRR
jgi:hypothetical protein